MCVHMSDHLFLYYYETIITVSDGNLFLYFISLISHLWFTQGMKHELLQKPAVYYLYFTMQQYKIWYFYKLSFCLNVEAAVSHSLQQRAKETHAFVRKGGSSPLYPVADVCVWGRQGQNVSYLISSSNPGAVQQVQASSREWQCSCRARQGRGLSGLATEG